MRCVHLSDLHLLAEDEGTLLGVRTRDSARLVMEAARSTRPDLWILGGDLSQDGSEESYRSLVELLQPSGAPVLYVPGNHDQRERMHPVLTEAGWHGGPLYASGNWLFVLLDSVIEGAEGGRLGSGQLEILREALHHRGPLAVVLHHSPFELDTPWLDTMVLEDREEFRSLLGRRSDRTLVLFGHVHQEWRSAHGQVEYLSVPSTCFQFALGQAEFGLDPAAPGFRRLHLEPDGTWDSSVTRVLSARQEPQSAAGGY